MMMRVGIVVEIEEHTVLDIVGASLALRDLAEDRGAMPCSSSIIPSFAVSARFAKACWRKTKRDSEGEEDGGGNAHLHDERSSLMACKHGLLAFEGLVDAKQRRLRIGVDEKRRCDVLRKIGRAVGPMRAQ
jgi:hypothetical protein